MVAAMSDMNQQRLDRTIWAAGLAIAFERIWAALLWPIVIGAAALALALSGLLPGFPPLFRLVWPTRYLAMRRIERASGFDHRPVSAFNDELASGDGDPRQGIIWQE